VAIVGRAESEKFKYLKEVGEVETYKKSDHFRVIFRKNANLAIFGFLAFFCPELQFLAFFHIINYWSILTYLFPLFIH